MLRDFGEEARGAAGLGVHEIKRWIGADPGERGRAVECVLWLAVLGQFALLAYDPLALVPSHRDREAGRAVVARLAAIEGDVLVPHHPYLAMLAGKSSFAHTLAMDNVLMDDHGPAGQDLVGEMARAIEERRFAAILVESDQRYAGTFSQGYELRERLLPDPDVFWTVTGYRVRPELLFLPKARGAASP